MDPIKSLLGEDDYQAIRNALDILTNLEAHIDQAKRGGLDVSQHEQQLRDTRDKLLRMKNAYFPGRT